MRRNVCFLLCAAALSVLGATSRASADVYDRDYGVDPTRIYGGLWLGFGGDAEADGDSEFSGDLETTVGGQFGVDVVTSRYFSLGGEARFGAVKWKAGDRSKLIDLDFKPRLRFPVARRIELYVAVPVGLTIPRLSEIGDGQDDNGKVGWNIGAGGGANFWITEDFGLNVEPMWMLHKFKVDGPANDFTLKQFGLLLNVLIAL